MSAIESPGKHAAAVSEADRDLHVLVFGPAGNVGRPLVEQLAQTLNVRRLTLAYHRRVPDLATLRAARPDLDVAALPADLASIDSLHQVVHARGVPHRIVFMTPTQAGNAPLIRNFTSFCLALHPAVQLVVYVSEGDVDEAMQARLQCYPEVMASFAHIMGSGLPVVRLEPAGFFQNLLQFKAYGLLDFVRSGQLVYRTGVEGSTVLGWVDATDIADAAARVAVTPDPHLYAGKHFRLVSDRFSMTELAAKLAALLQRPVAYEQRAEAELQRQFVADGMSLSLAADRAYAFCSYHEGHFPVLSADPSELRSLLGGREPHTIDDWLAANRTLLLQSQALGTAQGSSLAP